MNDLSLRPTRQDVVLAASLWLKTPYRHQASTLGAGADCLGLVRGVWRMVLGTEPQLPPAYAPDWDVRDDNALQQAADAHLVRLPMGTIEAGDILLFQLRAGFSARHLAIAASPTTMIHAYSGLCVSQTSINPWWQRHMIARYLYPNILTSTGGTAP